MDLELLKEIFEVCIIPLLGVLTAYLVKLINKKIDEISGSMDDGMSKKYMDILKHTITECINATNQTYVDSLKGKNVFTEEAQKEALEKTYNAVMNILTEDAKECLAEVYDDLEIYIKTKIESEINKGVKEIES